MRWWDDGMVGWLINYLSIACSIKLQSHITCFEGMKCPGAPNDLMCFREETPHLSFLPFQTSISSSFQGLIEGFETSVLISHYHPH